jgi:radical SAM family RiPP maturation amino acid epimerase
MSVAVPPVDAYHDALLEHAAAKRFYERWVADPGFRKALLADPAGTLDSYGLDLRPDDIRSLLDADVTKPSPATRAMWRMVAEKTRWVSRFYRGAATPDDPRMLAWRNRQIRRQLLDLGPFPTNSNIHASWCAELTQGCSGGCWFCAVSALRLTGVFQRDELGGALWRGVLETLRDWLGPASRSGFLYWATDPLDNPDYELFCLDMYEVLGVFPPTTTAFALRDPARVRRLLAMAEERDCWINRFSILSITMLDRVHREYDATELARVECLPLNRESAFAFGNAGRFRERARKDPSLLERQRENLRWAPWYTGDPAYAGGDEYPIGSIGCVTGFLLNMVERRVQLISPCNANDRWPDGVLVFADEGFENASDLARVLERMADRWMSPVVRSGDRVRFWDWLRYEELPDGFKLVGRFRQEVTCVDPTQGDDLRALGDLVRQGTLTADEVASTLEATRAVRRERVQRGLDELLAAGVLDDLAAAAA